MAKRSTGAQVITSPRNEVERWLLDTVARHANRAGIKTPEVAVYDAPEMNAFATGPSRNNSHFPVNTVQIMRGAVAAEMDGQLPKYTEAVFGCMWEQDLKMDDAEVIKAALDAAGLDAARVLARIQEPEVKDKLLKNTEATVARGTFGAPTFFVGNEIFFGKDKLSDVEEEIAAQKMA
jgi:2-hydroxychromene-2-carboxylate isomerase